MILARSHTTDGGVEFEIGEVISVYQIFYHMRIHKCPVGVREGVKKPFFLGLCLKLWVGGGPKSQTF